MNVFATPWLATALISLMLAMAPLQMNAIGEATRPSHNTSAAIIRVALAGNDSPGCGTDAAPCRSIAFAIRQAAAGDEIRIAAGTYTGAGADPAAQIALGGELLEGGEHRVARDAEVARERPARRQPRTRLQPAGQNRVADREIELAVKRLRAARIERQAREMGGSGPPTLRARHGGPDGLAPSR
jgi:hypothetical protein